MKQRIQKFQGFLKYWLGPILFVWLAISIYHQILNQANLHSTLLSMQASLNGPASWKLLMICGLMVINWSIEARKWQVLLLPVEKMSWWKCLQATLSGVAFAINTPNRIGEYGGRILYVQEGHRIQAVSLTIMGSFSQLLITMLLGCGGLIYLLDVTSGEISQQHSLGYKLWLQVMLYTVSIISVFCTLLYFRLGMLVKLAEKIPGSLKWLQHITVLENLGVRNLLRVFSLSLGRYVVFAIQFILMLQLMQVSVTVWQAFWLIAIMFLLLALIPTIALAEIGVRGKVSLALFGLFSANSVGIVTASVGIWFINLVIPALFGSLLILGIKIADK